MSGLEKDLLFAALAVLTGGVGGMLGVGGGVLLFPALVLAGGIEPHAARAATLLLSAVISAGATLQHRGDGTLVPRVVKGLVAVAVLGGVAGVLAGNLLAGRALRSLFGGFLLIVVLSQLRRLTTRTLQPRGKATARRIAAVGLVMGACAGLLGIGGGVFAVPAQESFLGVRLRSAMANSSAVILELCLVSGVVALVAHGNRFQPAMALRLAGLMALPALAGGFLGARAARFARGMWIRVAFATLLLAVAARLMAS